MNTLNRLIELKTHYSRKLNQPIGVFKLKKLQILPTSNCTHDYINDISTQLLKTLETQNIDLDLFFILEDEDANLEWVPLSKIDMFKQNL